MRTIIMAAAIVAASVSGAAAGPLEALRWQKRILLVFEQGDGERSNSQRRELTRNEGVRERDILIIEVPGSGTVEVDGVGQVDAAALRRAYAIADDASFTVLLIGKDGGVKRREMAPITARDLFATIDAMPMRASEMRRG